MSENVNIESDVEMSEAMSHMTRERWGVEVVTRHYEKLGYKVEKSPEKWVDLIATKGDEKLLIEVKARKDKTKRSFVDLSEAQFNALSDENYRLCLVYPNEGEPVIKFVTIQDIRKILTRFRLYI